MYGGSGMRAPWRARAGSPTRSVMAGTNPPQAQRAPDMSAYSSQPAVPPAQQGPVAPAQMMAYSGQAQAVPERSLGTSYSPASVQSYTLPGYQESGRYGGPMTFAGQSGAGNYAYAKPEQRPQPFTARYTAFDGSVSDQPNYAQRDAFIQSANDAMLPYYSGKAHGAPQFDVQSMWSNAGKMADDGFRNPFSPGGGVQALESYLAKYAPAAMYR